MNIKLLLTCAIISFISTQTIAKVTIDEGYKTEEEYYNNLKENYAKYKKNHLYTKIVPRDSSYTDKPIIHNGSSNSSCTTIYPPINTSASTHDIYINGVYEDQTNHEASHTRGVAQKITHDGGTTICAAYTSARHYSFIYEITAYKK
jgi:hypothetical protein